MQSKKIFFDGKKFRLFYERMATLAACAVLTIGPYLIFGGRSDNGPPGTTDSLPQTRSPADASPSKSQHFTI
jgi:hypothetical protein